MKSEIYKKQARLLLNILPEVAKETCFAMHGGTAINLFVRDMPRLSVDIDLTYTPIEDRAISLQHITEALTRIKNRIESTIPGINIKHKQDAAKLFISLQEVNVKVEVNLTGRGVIEEPIKMHLCKKAETEFDTFAVMQIVPLSQLYGGKICAALDRQHPRDLFDVKFLLANEGFSDEIKRGFLLCLISGDRPIHEIISPKLQDQELVLNNQFSGMSEEEFTYGDYIYIRNMLIDTVKAKLTEYDREFLLSVKALTPDWGIYNFERFSAVQWKLHNLQKLRDTNLDKYKKQYELLKQSLDFTIV
jgi:predicted nucleotidyltransferase component of viral defense system